MAAVRLPEVLGPPPSSGFLLLWLCLWLCQTCPFPRSRTGGVGGVKILLEVSQETSMDKDPHPSRLCQGPKTQRLHGVSFKSCHGHVILDKFIWVSVILPVKWGLRYLLRIVAVRFNKLPVWTHTTVASRMMAVTPRKIPLTAWDHATQKRVSVRCFFFYPLPVSRRRSQTGGSMG